MASQDEINDPLWELMQLYFILHNFPTIDDSTFDKQVNWVKTNLQCSHELAHKIVNNRMFKRSHMFGATGWIFDKCPLIPPEEELAYQRWMATKDE